MESYCSGNNSCQFNSHYPCSFLIKILNSSPTQTPFINTNLYWNFSFDLTLVSFNSFLHLVRTNTIETPLKTKKLQISFSLNSRLWYSASTFVIVIRIEIFKYHLRSCIRKVRHLSICLSLLWRWALSRFRHRFRLLMYARLFKRSKLFLWNEQQNERPWYFHNLFG